MRIKFVQNLIDRIRNKDSFRETSAREGVNKLRKELLELKYIHLPALKAHEQVFCKYKNIYKGKEVVLVASGPTVKEYNMLNGAVHIGVNHTFTLSNVILDYLFIHDSLNNSSSSEMHSKANDYRRGLCKKMYGYHPMNIYSIAEQDAMNADAERYYFVDNEIPTSEYVLLSADITSRPLNCWASIVFPAMEFALYTHPKKIYLVGCDCAKNGHIYASNKKDFCSDRDKIIYGWEQIKKFANKKYPDIEIVSINPVGLKSLFKDVYTENYVHKHPELLKEDIEIITKENLC